MDRRDEESNEAGERRSRGTILRLAGAGFASVLAIAVPLDGSSRVIAGGPVVPAPEDVAAPTTLPPGWPGETPDLETPRQLDVWSIVHAACRRHGIEDEAVTMYHVLWEESTLRGNVSSPCGRYHGIGQFTLSTFRESVGKMRRLRLIWGDEEWSPFNPVQAIEVMAFMWSRGYHDHWGPYRRVVRQQARALAAANLN